MEPGLTGGYADGYAHGRLASMSEDELIEDLEEQPEEEVASVVDAASAARTVVELEHEASAH